MIPIASEDVILSISDGFNCGPNLGIGEFTANHVHNEITWD